MMTVAVLAATFLALLPRLDDMAESICTTSDGSRPSAASLTFVPMGTSMSTPPSTSRKLVFFPLRPRVLDLATDLGRGPASLTVSCSYELTSRERSGTRAGCRLRAVPTEMVLALRDNRNLLICTWLTPGYVFSRQTGPW